jgi:hypothetical protein
MSIIKPNSEQMSPEMIIILINFSKYGGLLNKYFGKMLKYTVINKT